MQISMGRAPVPPNLAPLATAATCAAHLAPLPTKRLLLNAELFTTWEAKHWIAHYVK